MCRNIRTLPSQTNAEAFDLAVVEVAAAARRLLDNLSTNAPPKDRATEADKARVRSRERFATT